MTWVRRHRRIQRECKPVRLDQGLGQVTRVLDHVDVRQVVAMADEALGHRRAIGDGEAVAPNPSGLQVRRRDDEHIAFPAAG